MTSQRPLVSVVIPAYNAEAYIAESLESILNQSYDNIEVLVIDDHSTDRTLDICKALALTDSRVRIISNEKNVGIGANRERGIQQSKGTYICWQDADDISLPDRVESQVAFLELHPHVGIVGGYITFFNEEGDGVTRKYSQEDKTLRRNIFRYNPVAQPASMMRRECFDRVGGYDPQYRLSEDLDMQFRIGELYEFGNVQKAVIKYRQTQSSLTAANLKKMELATLAIRKKYRYSKAYHYTFIDALYNLAQRASLNMPINVRMAIFKIIRGDSR